MAASSASGLASAAVDKRFLNFFKVVKDERAANIGEYMKEDSVQKVFGKTVKKEE